MPRVSTRPVGIAGASEKSLTTQLARTAVALTLSDEPRHVPIVGSISAPFYELHQALCVELSTAHHSSRRVQRGLHNLRKQRRPPRHRHTLSYLRLAGAFGANCCALTT